MSLPPPHTLWTWLLSINFEPLRNIKVECWIHNKIKHNTHKHFSNSVQFPSDLLCPVPGSWRTLFWWRLDACFFCQKLLVPTLCVGGLSRDFKGGLFSLSPCLCDYVCLYICRFALGGGFVCILCRVCYFKGRITGRYVLCFYAYIRWSSTSLVFLLVCTSVSFIHLFMLVVTCPSSFGVYVCLCIWVWPL